MTTEKQKESFLTQISEGKNSFECLGYILYWSLRNVDITMEQFASYLQEVGFDKKYAKPHNYRSTMIRSLRNLEEQRIIRLLTEDNNTLSYQFTAETKVEHDKEAELQYDMETIVVIDKIEYRRTQNFEQSLIKGKPEIKEKLIELFEKEKTRYHSGDVSRYIQRIFRDQADIISLREQGNVYFVPAAYENVITKAFNLLQKIGGANTLTSLPIPNVEACKATVKASFLVDVDTDVSSMEKDIDKIIDGDKGVSEKWSKIRIDRVRNLLDRVEKYKNGGVVGDKEAAKIQANMESLSKRIKSVRVLNIED